MFNVEAEELDDRKVQTAPPGFHIIFLPFADDFRKLKLDGQLPRGKLFHLFCCEIYFALRYVSVMSLLCGIHSVFCSV